VENLGENFSCVNQFMMLLDLGFIVKLVNSKACVLDIFSRLSSIFFPGCSSVKLWLTFFNVNVLKHLGSVCWSNPWRRKVFQKNRFVAFYKLEDLTVFLRDAPNSGQFCTSGSGPVATGFERLRYPYLCTKSFGFNILFLLPFRVQIVYVFALASRVRNLNYLINALL
jgi:hypothetical protein